MNTFEKLVLRALAEIIRCEWAWVRKTDRAEQLVKDLDAAAE